MPKKKTHPTSVPRWLKDEEKQQRGEIRYELDELLERAKQAKAALRKGNMFDVANAVRDVRALADGAETLLSAQQVYVHIISSLERIASDARK